MGIRRTAWLAALALVVAGCSADTDDTARPEPDASSPSASPSASPPASSAPTARQPLVLAFDLHRPGLDLTLARARRIVAGEPVRWSDLGQDGGAIRVRQGPGAVAAAARDRRVVAVVPGSMLRPIVQPATIGGVDPLRHPARYPLTTASDRPPGPVTTVTVVGDIMLGRGVGAAHPADPGAPLRPLAGRLRAADLTVGNLESTLSDDGIPRQPGDDSFASDPSAVIALAAAGFDVLSLANNHTGDYGPRAFRQTLRRIDQSPIRRVGAGTDATQAWRPVVVRRNGTSFGFVAFNSIGETPRATANRPGAAEVRMPIRTGPLSQADLRRLTQTIARLANRVDVVIALPHWGDQYTNVPLPVQRRVGAAMIDAGADLVAGGHPHWVQGIQTHRGRLVVHSLGNFVFDMDIYPENEEGVMLELTFWGSDLMAAGFEPYVIDADFVPRAAAGPRAEATLDRLWSASDPPFRR